MGNSQGKPAVFTDEVNLNHFRLLRVVGKGAFGKVRVVERRDTGLTFALKYIRKDEVVRSESVRNIIRERRMLEHLNHPFICNLRYSFQDIEYMYLVVDLMNGGDLRFHISRKTFTEETIRFWIAELGCALRYIHGQGIIHRDVKPDNVLLDSEGHIHLADFNVASDFTPKKLLLSRSGTLAYLAPEIYKGTGYSFTVDWWSLGVLFYECIYSKRPFEGSSQPKLSEAITKASPKFPVTSPPVSMPCLHAISSLLEPDPSKRLGSENFESFSSNPFFRELDFEALERKEYDPVFIPPSDKTNFDATYDLEELLLEEAPLEARSRRQKPRERLKEGASEKEIRVDELYKLIDTSFLPFNYTLAAYERISGDGSNGTEAASGNTVSRYKSSAALMPEAMPSKSINIFTGRKRRGSRSSRISPSDSPTLPTSQSPPPPLPLDHYHQIQLSKSRSQSPQSDNPNTAQPSVPKDITSHPQQNTSNLLSSPQSQTRSQTPSQSINSEGLSPDLSPYQQSYTRPHHSAGIKYVPGEDGSWSELAGKDSTLPADARLIAINGAAGKHSKMLGFLNRKKGRGLSPKPQQKGVLGKEGARIVISNG